ncbi:hypothetical protein IMZ48_34285 [Candidatus Bathyarchaeota archaeon]|nr:hypothetical protein [Candidatus Bathyarchaeota archaeon]
MVSDILTQDPATYLPADLDPTLIAGHASQLAVLAHQLNSSSSAALELLFTGAPTFSLINLKTLSRGSIHLSPDDDGVSTEPVADYRALSNPIDIAVNRALLTFIRRFASSEGMVDALAPELVSPLIDETSDEFEAWLRGTLNPSVAHPSGTCALGPRELGGVVGPELRVHGTRGLRVADCSVMTLVPGTHTSSTAYAIGEKVCFRLLGHFFEGAWTNRSRRRI